MTTKNKIQPLKRKKNFKKPIFRNIDNSQAAKYSQIRKKTHYENNRKIIVQEKIPLNEEEIIQNRIQTLKLKLVLKTIKKSEIKELKLLTA